MGCDGYLTMLRFSILLRSTYAPPRRKYLLCLSKVGDFRDFLRCHNLPWLTHRGAIPVKLNPREPRSAVFRRFAEVEIEFSPPGQKKGTERKIIKFC